MSAIIVTLFFGGPSGPDFGITGWVSDYVLPFVWFFAKVFVFLCMFVLFRATLPRLRYDQLMDLGWKILIPLSLGWFLVLAGLRVAADDGSDVGQVLLTGLVGAAGLAVGAGLLWLAIRSAASKRAGLETGEHS
jgi:NADH-quinone oxidoreductase subunit H